MLVVGWQSFFSLRARTSSKSSIYIFCNATKVLSAVLFISWKMVCFGVNPTVVVFVPYSAGETIFNFRRQTDFTLALPSLVWLNNSQVYQICNASRDDLARIRLSSKRCQVLLQVLGTVLFAGLFNVTFIVYVCVCIVGGVPQLFR